MRKKLRVWWGGVLDRWSPWRLRKELKRTSETAREAMAFGNREGKRADKETARCIALRKDLDARLEDDARRANPDAVKRMDVEGRHQFTRIPVIPTAAVCFHKHWMSMEHLEIETREGRMQEYRVSICLTPIELAHWGRPEIAAFLRREISNEAEKIALRFARSTPA